mmetsp:Transcript_14581/g.43843  ORF Transcript_14581/g.43843 Transcript_14581/m.43843 type:complete len:222 (+) Transcript_14581:991-1656(+)
MIGVGVATRLGVRTCKRIGVRIGVGTHHLIDDHDGDVELLCGHDEPAEVRGQQLLALGELAAAQELGAEERHHAIHDDGAEIAVLGEDGLGKHDALHLLLVRVAATHVDIVERLRRIEAKAVGDLLDALRPEVAFGIDVKHLAHAAALLQAELRRHAERVHQLRLARAVLAVELGDGAGLDAAAQDLVERRRARRHVDDLLLAVQHLEAGAELAQARHLAT